jgi:hypothetical protein
LDEAIASFLDATTTADAESWRALRDRLSVDDHYSLMTFADRRSALALRSGQSTIAMSAVEALALLDADRVDYRDLDVDFPVYALRATNGDERHAMDFALTRAHPKMRSLFERRKGHQLSLADCGWFSFQSRHGLGFIRTWKPVPRDPSLLRAAVAIADRLDARGGYEATDLHLGSLSWVWFRRRPADGARLSDEIPTLGCVTISADDWSGSSKPSLLVILADVVDAATARVLVDLARGASDPIRPREAASQGARLLVAVANQPVGDKDPADTDGELAALVSDLSEAALSEPVNA